MVSTRASLSAVFALSLFSTALIALPDHGAHPKLDVQNKDNPGRYEGKAPTVAPSKITAEKLKAALRSLSGDGNILSAREFDPGLSQLAKDLFIATQTAEGMAILKRKLDEIPEVTGDKLNLLLGRLFVLGYQQKTELDLRLPGFVKTGNNAPTDQEYQSSEKVIGRFLRVAANSKPEEKPNGELQEALYSAAQVAALPYVTATDKPTPIGQIKTDRELEKKVASGKDPLWSVVSRFFPSPDIHTSGMWGGNSETKLDRVRDDYIGVQQSVLLVAGQLTQSSPKVNRAELLAEAPIQRLETLQHAFFVSSENLKFDPEYKAATGKVFRPLTKAEAEEQAEEIRAAFFSRKDLFSNDTKVPYTAYIYVNAAPKSKPDVPTPTLTQEVADLQKFAEKLKAEQANTERREGVHETLEALTTSYRVTDEHKHNYSSPETAADYEVFSIVDRLSPQRFEELTKHLRTKKDLSAGDKSVVRAIERRAAQDENNLQQGQRNEKWLADIEAKGKAEEIGKAELQLRARQAEAQRQQIEKEREEESIRRLKEAFQPPPASNTPPQPYTPPAPPVKPTFVEWMLTPSEKMQKLRANVVDITKTPSRIRRRLGDYLTNVLDDADKSDK